MKPRTVMLAAPYFPPDLGGVERYVWNLARLLRARHGYRPVVVAAAGPGAEPGRSEGPDGVPVYRLSTLGRISHTPIGLTWRRQMRRIMAREDVGLVNAHAPVPLFADAAARARGDVPFVLTYHTGRLRTGRRLADLVCATYERVLLTGTVRRASEVICSSEFVAADLSGLLTGPTTTISPGVDTGCFTATPPPVAPRVVFVASLARATRYKGLADLLRAVAVLRRRIPTIHLDVVGDGSLTPEYQRLSARLGIDGHVTFTGRLEGEALAAAYRRARVLALPTSYDSFPTVLVEAMASGRPVVTTPVGGIPSLVRHGHNGLLVEPGDGEGLVRAIEAVLTDDGLARRLGAAGGELVVGELSWERQADRTAAVFERAVRSGARR